MKENEEGIFVRSEAIESLVNYRLSFFLRYGLLLLFLVFVMILALSWFIKIPETIAGVLTLNTTNPPKTIVAKSTGKIISLKTSNKSHVNKGDVLVLMESLADYRQVKALQDSINKMDSLITLGLYGSLQQTKPDFKNLGELQKSFENFIRNKSEFEYALSQPVYAAKRSVIEGRLYSQNLMYYSLLEQQEILRRDFDIARENYETEKRLYNEKVSSLNDVQVKEGILLSRRLAYEQIGSSITQCLNSSNEIRGQLIQLNEAIETQKNSFIFALNTMKSDIQQWFNTYVLVAPIEGNVSFVEMLTENQNVKTDDILFYIIPDGSDLIGEVSVEQMNFGKIKTGQVVNIKFAGFAYQEFGIVKATVRNISDVPKLGKYIVTVNFPQGLMTNYHREIPYHNGLTGTAEIITDNRSLLNKLILDRFKSIIRR